MKKKSLLNLSIYKRALADSLVKLDPGNQIKKPVMFIVYICSFITTYITIMQIINGKPFAFDLQITLWLWFTLLFANFSEALAEGQGKARADSLKKSRTEIIARNVSSGREVRMSASDLKIDDLVVCETGDVIPCDGEVIEGIASVDESAITGESAPVIRENGGDRNSVTIGTRVISDRIIVKVTAEIGNSFLDRMIKMIEGAKRQKTPNEIALMILLSGLTVIFLVTVVTLFFFYSYTGAISGLKNGGISITILVSLLVCLIPTTIGGLLNAVGISGMDRLLDKNIIAMSGKAVEASGDIDVILLDKTGTITYGNRMAYELMPAPGIDIQKLSYHSFLSSMPDKTPEGKSIIYYINKNFGLKEESFTGMKIEFIPFSANTRMSGVEYEDEHGNMISIKKGAAEAIKGYIKAHDGIYPHEIDLMTDNISRRGGTPLVVIRNNQVLGVIYLKDTIKKGIKERFMRLRKMGIKTVMITGDNPLTAATIAAEAGVDDFIAEANPESKLKLIAEEQENGHLVAMIGDGTNDAPALAQADVGVVMNSGTQTAKEAGNMVDLDNNPTKLIEVVETGKQLLMTRGSLTTFSIANDIAKYFAIIPAMFADIFLDAKGQGALSALNIMRLASPESAILSSVIFNALIIVALIPLALKGVKYKPAGANPVLFTNLLIYGIGGMAAPFIGIKIIDLIINFLGVV